MFNFILKENKRGALIEKLNSLVMFDAEPLRKMNEEIVQVNKSFASNFEEMAEFKKEMEINRVKFKYSMHFSDIFESPIIYGYKGERYLYLGADGDFDYVVNLQTMKKEGLRHRPYGEVDSMTKEDLYDILTLGYHFYFDEKEGEKFFDFLSTIDIDVLESFFSVGYLQEELLNQKRGARSYSLEAFPKKIEELPLKKEEIMKEPEILSLKPEPSFEIKGNNLILDTGMFSLRGIDRVFYKENKINFVFSNEDKESFEIIYDDFLKIRDEVIKAKTVVIY